MSKRRSGRANAWAWFGRVVLAALVVALGGCQTITPDRRGDIAWAHAGGPSGTATFTVRLNERRADGKSWRGSGAVFFGIPGLSITPQVEVANAPSALLCLVAANGAWACPGALRELDDMKRMASPCHLSFDCEFEQIKLPPGESFGLVIISHGILLTDLVDAAIISRKKLKTTDPQYKEINKKLREFIEKLLPADDSDERLRRRRPFPLLTLEDCEGASCTLRQSILKIELL